MKRQYVDLDRLASWDNLNLALWKAAKGKRRRPDVIQFIAAHEANLSQLRKQILDLQLPLDQYRCFQIKDPKPRKITAVSFELRVVHHAIINLIGENLEKSQINNSYACLPRRGAHAAVQRVQRGLRRGQWCVKIDIEKYFEHIDHQRLKEKLACRFKGQGFIMLLDTIIDSYHELQGRGLPIGSLTSQYFANFYLERCDRFIEQMGETLGYVRYMDDMIWFCHDKHSARNSLEKTINMLEGEKLTVKSQRWVQPTYQGVNYCGYRILPYRILLSRRKKRSYEKHLQTWQAKWNESMISSLELQRAYDAVHATTWLAHSRGFRQTVLARTQGIEA